MVSMVSWSNLRHDTRMGGHTVRARMTLHHGIEWGQGPAWARSRSTPGRLAAYRDVSGWVMPDTCIRQQSGPGSCPYQHGHRSNGRPFCKNVATNEDQGQNFAFTSVPPPSQRSPPIICVGQQWHVPRRSTPARSRIHHRNRCAIVSPALSLLLRRTPHLPRRRHRFHTGGDPTLNVGAGSKCSCFSWRL